MSEIPNPASWKQISSLILDKGYRSITDSKQHAPYQWAAKTALLAPVLVKHPTLEFGTATKTITAAMLKRGSLILGVPDVVFSQIRRKTDLEAVSVSDSSSHFASMMVIPKGHFVIQRLNRAAELMVETGIVNYIRKKYGDDQILPQQPSKRNIGLGYSLRELKGGFMFYVWAVSVGGILLSAEHLFCNP